MVDVNCVNLIHYDAYSGREDVITLNGVDVEVKKVGDAYTLSHAGFENVYDRIPKVGEMLTDGEYDIIVSH